MRNRSRAFLTPALALAAAAMALTAVAAPTASAHTQSRLVFQEGFTGPTWQAAAAQCQTVGQQLLSQGKFDRFNCVALINPISPQSIDVGLDGYIDSTTG